MPAAQQVLSGLPADAYGQAFVVADATSVTAPLLDAPPRVQVCVLTACEQRCVLAEVVSGWAAEWLPQDAVPGEDVPSVWVLPGAAAALAGGGHEGVTRLITALPTHQLMQG